MVQKLFRNASTNENVKKLACLSYYYDKRGDTYIGLDLLKASGIIDMTFEDILINNKRNKSVLSKYTQNLIRTGFITCISEKYAPGIFRKRYRVNKSEIVSYYGNDEVGRYKEIFATKFGYRYSKEAFIKQFEKIEIEEPTIENILYEIPHSGVIVFYRDGIKIRTIKYKDRFGKQGIQLKSFFYNKSAIMDFVQSIVCSDVPEFVKETLEVINEGVPVEFNVEFKVHNSICLTKSEKTIVFRKSARAYSSFCSYNKHNGERQKILERESLTQEFDINSTVPRLTYFLNTGKWLSNSVDFYKVIYERSGITKEWNTTMREHIKTCFMRIYFVDTHQKSYRAYTNIRYKIPHLLTEEEYKYLFIATRKVLGKTYGTSIFYYESLLELDVVYHFKKLGYIMTHIYDGFFFKDDLPKSEVEKYISENVERIFQERL